MRIVAFHADRVATVLILKAESFAAAALDERVSMIFPGVACRSVHRLRHARSVLEQQNVDILITGVDIPDGDVVDLLSVSSENGSQVGRVIVVTWHREMHLISVLRSLNVHGVFDLGSEPLEKFDEVLQIVGRGDRYWSVGLEALLRRPDSRALLHQLTPSEELALATFGDGCGDKAAAERLGMSFSATRALRRDLYGKINVHDRAELIRFAVERGYVRFTPEGVFPVGLSVLRDRHRAVSRR